MRALISRVLLSVNETAMAGVSVSWLSVVKPRIRKYQNHHYSRTVSAPVSGSVSRNTQSSRSGVLLTRITRRAHWSAIVQTCVPT